MTFDFSPFWIERTETTTQYVGAAASPVTLSPLAPPPPCAPAQPTNLELAALVEELFTEGTLSYDQLRALSQVPELHPLLGDAVEGVPAERRTSGVR